MKKIFYILLVLSSVSSANSKSTNPNVDNYVGNSDQEFKYRRQYQESNYNEFKFIE
jgi:hypothetical protein